MDDHQAETLLGTAGLDIHGAYHVGRPRKLELGNDLDLAVPGKGTVPGRQGGCPSNKGGPMKCHCPPLSITPKIPPKFLPHPITHVQSVVIQKIVSRIPHLPTWIFDARLNSGFPAPKNFSGNRTKSS